MEPTALHLYLTRQSASHAFSTSSTISLEKGTVSNVTLVNSKGETETTFAGVARNASV